MSLQYFKLKTQLLSFSLHGSKIHVFIIGTKKKRNKLLYIKNSVPSFSVLKRSNITEKIKTKKKNRLRSISSE